MKLSRVALTIAMLGYASGALAAEIFSSDCESGALSQIFDVNAYGNMTVSLSTDFAYSGTRSIKMTYPNDEAGAELRIPAFPATPSLYTRKREYYAPGWETNWPVGLKTSRYFTTPDFQVGSSPNAYAYMSEKLIWQGYDGNQNDQYARGLNNAIGNLDLIETYPSTTLFGNGLPYIRTGHWYKYETWMVLNSGVDVPDGILQVWIDDQLVQNLTNVRWRSSTRGSPNGTGWRSMWFGGNYTSSPWAGPNQPVHRYIDDFYLSTTLDRGVSAKPAAIKDVVAK